MAKVAFIGMVTLKIEKQDYRKAQSAYRRPDPGQPAGGVSRY